MKTANTEHGLTLRLDETMPARVSAIGETMDRIMATVRQGRCVREQEHDIDLAVREAVANAVRHGSHKDPDKTIRITSAGDGSRHGRRL